MTAKRFCLVAAWFLGVCVLPAQAADFEIKNDAEFKKIIPEGAKIGKLIGGLGFIEGPAWIGSDGGYLLFSDIPNNKIMKWTVKDGISVFRADSHNSNGNTVDPQGRLVTAEHTGRAVTRTEKDGKVTILADAFGGKKLNSPNDVVVASSGAIYFTDPDYGTPKDQQKEQDGNYVYRIDPKTQNVSRVVSDFDHPNGLALSPDEKKLYIADSGKPRHIRVFDVKSDGMLEGGAVFCTIDKGGPDGIRCDADGRVWSSAGDGIHVFGPDGKLIAKLLTPEIPNPRDASKMMREAPANLAFGGADGKTLYITARTTLYSIRTNVKDARSK